MQKTIKNPVCQWPTLTFKTIWQDIFFFSHFTLQKKVLDRKKVLKFFEAVQFNFRSCIELTRQWCRYGEKIFSFTLFCYLHVLYILSAPKNIIQFCYGIQPVWFNNFPIIELKLFGVGLKVWRILSECYMGCWVSVVKNLILEALCNLVAWVQIFCAKIQNISL